MTTEQCSVDSLLPKTRTETFARQLQTRLQKLNSGNERDGLEDTSWNGDQLSSSSDDIYYDVDSFPGSPAEEANEIDYKEYINLNKKSTDPSSSGNKFLNHDYLLEERPEDDVDCGYLKQYSKPVSINHSGTQNCCSDLPEKEFMFCDQCTTNSDEVPVSKINERINNFPSSCTNHERLSEPHIEENDLLTKRNESLYEISILHCFNNLSINNEDHQSRDYNINNCNSIETRLQNGELSDTIENSQNLEDDKSRINFTRCLCDPSNNEPTVDENRNSYRNNNLNFEFTEDRYTMTITSNESTGREVESEKKATNEYHENSKEYFLSNGNHTDEKSKQKNNADYYTEEDLTRLVDAVFLKSQEKDFNIDACCHTTTGRNIKENDVDEENCNVCYQDDNCEESIESKRSKFRRCSSLKSGKTPPGTPGCKKIVRFADVLGLDLADVRTFLDEVPKVPKSAFIDLKNVELSSSPPVNTSLLDSFMERQTPSTNMKMQRTIVPLFQQPSSRSDFLDRVRDDFVCLENSIISDSALFVITGFVRVKNIDFHKSVHIRYSIDNWKSFADLQAKYVPNSCDGFSDKFTFVLYAHMLNVGQRLEFAIRYHSSGSLFWDNNRGANYTFQCVPNGPTQVVPSMTYVPPTPMETWASFY